MAHRWTWRLRSNLSLCHTRLHESGTTLRVGSLHIFTRCEPTYDVVHAELHALENSVRHMQLAQPCPMTRYAFSTAFSTAFSIGTGSFHSFVKLCSCPHGIIPWHFVKVWGGEMAYNHRGTETTPLRREVRSKVILFTPLLAMTTYSAQQIIIAFMGVRISSGAVYTPTALYISGKQMGRWAVGGSVLVQFCCGRDTSPLAWIRQGTYPRRYLRTWNKWAPE